MIEERVRVLFHLNGYTKVMAERTEGLGMADGGITMDVPTEIIPAQFRTIGSRFVLLAPTTSEEVAAGAQVRPLPDGKA